MSQNRKDTRQQAADSMSNTTRRSNAVDFLFWLTIAERTCAFRQPFRLDWRVGQVGSRETESLIL
ncbi:hypothetical protein HMPREF9120_02328 [Neisseria sp. oral taxon 020 str. F0370]|nr:hypothetical protein HMPREF9120_02328 [Neisseria sp. oral taxon 020 str. F0370]